MELGDPSSFLDEECDEDLDLSVNGEHRSFWYNFSTFKQVIEEINNILQRRSEDNNGVARKASVEALENIICFDLTYLTQDNFQLFMLAVYEM
ncbi:uncharacterized protein CEXT_290841 [Caerostris extrusa]|uniref:Uncharacterized protein n=1 Tax=Caerostris extrusa TaxID=172846 RepID=A0AAV4R912_CAEEX|nr:uncharacterized protein CEXT_290841 [Caerostris extrusa]